MDISQGFVYWLNGYPNSRDLEKILPSVLVDSTTASPSDTHS